MTVICNMQAVIDRITSRPRTGKGPSRTPRPEAPPSADDRDPDDDYFIARARSAADGGKFARLWDGDLSDYGGDHSRADLALCRKLVYWCGPGVDPAKIDRLFRQSRLFRAKWDEPHRRDKATYGQMTIEKAFEQEGRGGVQARTGEIDPGCGNKGVAVIANFEDRPNPDRPGETARVPLSAAEIKRQMDAVTGGWPKVAGGVLFVDEGEARTRELESRQALFAFLGRACGCAESRILWSDRLVGAVAKGEFFAYLLQTATCYEAVTTVPHEPAVPGVYYASRPGGGGGDGAALRKLLGFFHPSSDIDRDLTKAAFLTPFWGGPPGGRPAIFITGPEEAGGGRGRGVGKSTLAEVIADLAGGALAVNAAKEDLGRVKTRILSTEGRTRRVLLLDNVKSHRLDSADLEALITTRVVSGHSMFVGEGRLPNYFTVLVTCNGASLSKDMAQRGVTLRLARPAYTEGWRRGVDAFVANNRCAIYDDIVAELRKQPAQLADRWRWQDWAEAVLARSSAAPDDCLREVLARQGEQDADAEADGRVAEALERALAAVRLKPDTAYVRFTSAAVTQIVRDATGEPAVTAERASSYIKGLQMPGWRKSDVNGRRGWEWVGANAGTRKGARMQIDHSREGGWRNVGGQPPRSK